MLDCYLEPEDYMENYYVDYERLADKVDKARDDFYIMIDMVQGNLPYDDEQWKDSLKYLNKLFDYDHPLTPPIFVRQNNIFELKLEETLRQQQYI